MEKTAITFPGIPPFLVAGATTFARWEACHWILSRPRAPYESSSLATPVEPGALWVLGRGVNSGNMVLLSLASPLGGKRT